jgi:Ca2+/Na+ antiporter
MEPLFYNLAFLISFWSCFALSFIYDNIKYTWLIYVWALVWPFWMWIIPRIYSSKSHKDAEKNKTEKNEKKENIVAAQGNKRVPNAVQFSFRHQ